MPAYLELAGNRATAVRLIVPASGPWIADVDFDAAVELEGAATLRVGELELVGTVDPGKTGSFGLRSKARLIAGGAGWRRSVDARHYHNDAGVKASTVLEGTASDVGETVADAPTTRLGVDWVRQAGRASRVLERLAPGWWVDYAGVTQVGARTVADVAGEVDLLDFDERHKVAVLAVDDLRILRVGSVLRSRLDRPLEVTALDVDVSADKLRVRALGRELAA